MTTESSGKIEGDYEYYYDREAELKAFEDSKAGVKGLVDGGVEKIPRIFVHNQSDINGKSNPGDCKFSIPVVDLEGIYRDANLRAKIVGQVRDACEKWGFFQLVNHGIPASVLEDMMDGVRRFHEQDIEVKKEFYSRDETRKFKFNTNFDFFQASASNWRDSLYCVMAPQPPHPEELPEICRDVIIDYSNKVLKLGQVLFELLSEALGLNPRHLKDMGCAEGLFLIGHYYPACPEPDLTLGTTKHTDGSFLTILLQDQVGGLQVLHEDHWVDVTPIPESLIVNVGDMSQLITNGKFRSVYHRCWRKVLARESLLPVSSERTSRNGPLQDSMGQLRSCYPKITRRGTEKPQSRSIQHSSTQKGLMGSVDWSISSVEFGILDHSGPHPVALQKAWMFNSYSVFRALIGDLDGLEMSGSAGLLIIYKYRVPF